MSSAIDFIPSGYGCGEAGSFPAMAGGIGQGAVKGLTPTTTIWVKPPFETLKYVQPGVTPISNPLLE